MCHNHHDIAAMRIADNIAMLHKGEFLIGGSRWIPRESSHPAVRQIVGPDEYYDQGHSRRVFRRFIRVGRALKTKLKLVSYFSPATRLTGAGFRFFVTQTQALAVKVNTKCVLTAL